DQGTQASLVETFGGGVDGRKVVFYRGLIVAQQAIFGMIDFKPCRPGASLTKGTYSYSRPELLLLGGREVKEPQAEYAATVAQAYQQAAPPSAHHFGGGDISFDDGFMPTTQSGNGGDASAVLIAQWQVEQQVRNARYLEPGKFEGQGLSD